MAVSRQLPERLPISARARTSRLMLETATRLMQSGATPSVSDVAEAAGVSRATAYRYFPTQAAMVEAVVDRGLGPILEWTSASDDPELRVAQLLETAIPRLEAFEATFRAALRLSLEQWARRATGELGEEELYKRGHRRELLSQAIDPLRTKLGVVRFDRLVQSLSLVFGVEPLIVLKDIWGLDGPETLGTAQWAARALVRAAIDEAGAESG